MAAGETETSRDPALDVDALVHDLKESARPTETPAPASPSPTVPEPVPLALHDAVIVSRRPLIGPLITAVRRFVLKLVRVPVEDLARQTLAAAQAGLVAEAAARERTEHDVRQLSLRLHELSAVTEPLSGLEASLDQLEIGQRVLASEQRLVSGDLKIRVEALQAELGRLRGQASGASPATPAPEPEPVGTGFDYYAFEERFRPEETVRERQQAYVDVLRGHEPVVDLGCGRGELVELLGRDGIRAYGVDLNSEFVVSAAERGVEVVHEDALDHLAGLERASVGGIVASHLVEHLPGAAVPRLVRLAFDRLADDGVLILETPNPESLVAGSVNFHRDLTHVRPIHPDTLEFVCTAAGFDDVEVRRLSPTPDDELLERAGTDDGALERVLNAVVDTLNSRLYGFQDYAVVARK